MTRRGRQPGPPTFLPLTLPSPPGGERVLTRGWVGLVVALVLGAGAGPAAGQDRPGTLYAAHRGGALLWPENSLQAFRNAAALGADYLELDVHLSEDGEPVVIHDPTLDRTTTGAGPVRERTLAELRGLRLKDRHGRVTGEGIPTLDEVLLVAKQGGCRLLLEIKVGPGRTRYPGIEEKVIAAVERHGLAPVTVLMAFEKDTWRRLRDLRPDLQAGALYEATASTLAWELDEARKAGVAFAGLHQALVDAGAVALARKAGLLLGVWTVNEREAIRRFIELGVGVVITDRPDWARELLGR